LGGQQQQQQQQQQQPQLARINASNIDNPVVKLAGLILGSPEFQRQ
jgi:transcription initiation factor TFIID subunit TAF12